MPRTQAERRERVNVTLERLRPAHGKAMLRWLREPSVRDNLGLRSTPTAERTRAFIATARDDTTVAARAIYADGEHVGTVVLDHLDRAAGKCRLHIYLGSAAVRGRGVGGAAVALALALAFEDLAFHKVWLTVHAKNPGAIAAYVAAGFQIEGVLRDEFLLQGERVNELHMGILACEWRERRARRLDIQEGRN